MLELHRISTLIDFQVWACIFRCQTRIADQCTGNQKGCTLGCVFLFEITDHENVDWNTTERTILLAGKTQSSFKWLVLCAYIFSSKNFTLLSITLDNLHWKKTRMFTVQQDGSANPQSSSISSELFIIDGFTGLLKLSLMVYYLH